ncbi:hypothetical protein MC885_007848 [Smutsia gigantea]|nr:hypothetical protein MC885_007848 [Smutsia gigantea]
MRAEEGDLPGICEGHRFADQRGARVAFTVSFLGSSAFYLLLAAACSPALPGMAFLFASRLPAVLMHTLPAAQMVIADLSAPEDRPAALARLGLCFGVGAILGSLLGGTLSEACGREDEHMWQGQMEIRLDLEETRQLPWASKCKGPERGGEG